MPAPWRGHPFRPAAAREFIATPSCNHRAPTNRGTHPCPPPNPHGSNPYGSNPDGSNPYVRDLRPALYRLDGPRGRPDVDRGRPHQLAEALLFEDVRTPSGRAPAGEHRR